MSMNINVNSPFYKGKEELPVYGNGNDKVIPKEQMVKYQFNTEDENGNKIMNKMTKEETLEALNKIDSLHGENVIVSISGDGLAALVENKYTRNMEILNETEEQIALREQKNDLFQKEITSNAPRRQMIPNIETNSALINSMKGLDEEVANTVYGIINDNLLKRDVGQMTEEERQNLIALGMEQANYIAQNYIADDKREQFIDVMQTIAKYGVNGKTNAEGKVSFDIKEGPMGGMPDDFYQLLEDISPEKYNEMKSLMEERSVTSDKGRQIEIGKRMIELMKQARSLINNSGIANMSRRDYSNWEEKVSKTEIRTPFEKTNYKDINEFIESINAQNNKNSFLNQDFLQNNVKQFFASLGLL